MIKLLLYMYYNQELVDLIVYYCKKFVQILNLKGKP